MKQRDVQSKKSIDSDAKQGTKKNHSDLSYDRMTTQDRMTLLDSIISNMPIILWAVDRNGKLLFCEGKGLSAFGNKHQDFTGKSLLETHRTVSSFEEDFRRALHGEFFCSTEKGKMEGQGVVFENWQGPLHGPNGNIVGVAGVAVDVTRRQKTEDDLRAEHVLMERLIDSHERDRRLTAYEIHDGLVQDATGAQMHLETLLRNDCKLSEQTRVVLGTCQELVRKIIIEARHLISGLRPPILDELGLVPAIKHLIDNHNKGGQNIDFKSDLATSRMTPLIEGAVFRIAQEAIANAARHSRSDKIQVRLQQQNHHLELEVSDYGIGFDLSNIEETRFGIQGMRERARLLSGQLEIDSSPGRGTRVFLRLPITTVPGVYGDSNQPE